MLALVEAVGSEKSSKSSRFGTGAGALALPDVAGGGLVESGAVAVRRGAVVLVVPLTDKELDRRVAATSSSPASYSSKFFLGDESLKPPLPLE